MFQPSMFREDRLEILHDFVAEHAFATIVSAAAGTLSADHLPLVLAHQDGPHGTLRGHLFAANPLVPGAPAVTEVLTIFQGPHTYITPY